MRSRNSRPSPAGTSFWACGSPNCIGKTGADADAYAKEVVASDFEEAGDGDVVRKVTEDLTVKGVTVSEQDIYAKLGELMAVAAAQIKSGT